MTYMYFILFTIFYQGSPFNKSWFPIGPWDKQTFTIIIKVHCITVKRQIHEVNKFTSKPME